MANDISKIKLPDNSVVNLVDKTSGYKKTDENVKQEASSGNYNYEVLLAGTSSTSTETTTARKSTGLKFNPSTSNLSVTKINGGAVGDSPKFTDTTYSAGTGLALSGTTFNHSNSVTAQTTQKVYPIKIDAQGHISAYGTSPTTLSGYGITDAKIASGVITLGSNTITPLTSASTLDATKLSGTIPSGCYTDTKNTAGTDDTSSKIYLVGSLTQSAVNADGTARTYTDNEVYVTSGALQTRTVSASQSVNANSSNANNAGGLALYSTDPTNYGVTMRGTGTSTGQLGTHGYVTDASWAGYLCFAGSANRGWIYRHGGANVASVNGVGNAVFNGSVTVGGNAANTSGARMEYNSTTKGLDIVFP